MKTSKKIPAIKKRLNRRTSIYTPGSEMTIRINYSASSRILEIEFTGGQVYHYFNVEPEVWDEYRVIIGSGGSSGTFVNKRIKPYYTFSPFP